MLYIEIFCKIWHHKLEFFQATERVTWSISSKFLPQIWCWLASQKAVFWFWLTKAFTTKLSWSAVPLLWFWVFVNSINSPSNFNFTKVHAFLKQCSSFYENKVLQLMSGGASLESFGERPYFHEMKIAQTLF